MSIALQLLEKELKDLKHSRDKSCKSFALGRISKELNLLHLSNLDPKIEELQIDINKLKNG